MSHFCHPLAASGPYPTPCHYVTRLLAPGLASAHHHPNVISLLPVSLHPVTLHPPLSVLKTVDLGLTSTPGSWLVRRPSSPPQARLRSQALSLRVEASDLFVQALQVMLMLARLRSTA